MQALVQQALIQQVLVQHLLVAGMAAEVIAAPVLDPADLGVVAHVKPQQVDREQLVKETTELQTLDQEVEAQAVVAPADLVELGILLVVLVELV
jgi:hypothetical protein